MARRKVLVLENEFLLNAGLRSLLSKEEDLEVMAAKFTGQTEIFQIIDTFQPDVVVMEEELVENGGMLVTSMKGHPNLKAIVVHWENNQIEIYESQKVVIRELQDFLSVI